MDPTGGGGKSTFGLYVESSLGQLVQIMKPGKYADMAYELDDSIHILLMDTPRSRSDVLQYHFLEDVKDADREAATGEFVSQSNLDCAL